MKVNPEYLKASHVALLVYPGCPTFDEQLSADTKTQDQLESELVTNLPAEPKACQGAKSTRD